VIFCAFRYVSGVTAVHPFDQRMVTAAKRHAPVFGYIDRLEADDQMEALDLAKRRFADGEFELTQRGQSVCQHLIDQAKARGDA
jgi:hypothetical protein